MAIGGLTANVTNAERAASAAAHSSTPHPGAQPSTSQDRVTHSEAGRAGGANIPDPKNAPSSGDDQKAKSEHATANQRAHEDRLFKTYRRLAIFGGLGTLATSAGLIVAALAINYAIAKAAIKNGVAEGLKKAGPLQVSLTSAKTQTTG